MCITLTTALGLAQAATTYIDKTQETNNYNRNAFQNAASANNSAILKYGQELSRQREDEANRTRSRNQLYIDEANSRGETRASSQNEGTSYSLTLQDLTRQTLRQINTIDAEAINAKRQGTDNLLGIHKEAESRINAIQPKNTTSLLNLAISGLGAVYDTKLNDQTNKKPTTSRGYNTQK